MEWRAERPILLSVRQGELLDFLAVQFGQTLWHGLRAKPLQESSEALGAQLKRPGYCMLITVHPLEVSIQKGLVDHQLRRQSHEKPLLAKVLHETVHRVPDATQMFLQGPAGAAPRRIGFQKTG